MIRMLLTATFLLSLLTLSISVHTNHDTEYDVIIIGGGPAGLSALSGLCRVSRKALLFDDGRPRNSVTRHMHDVIGADGRVPHEFKSDVRDQIDKYNLASWSQQTVVSIVRTEHDGPGRVWYNVTSEDRGTGRNQRFTLARRVILATGITDILPSIDGATDAYGKGMYWCPWCDGFEHRGEKLGILGSFKQACGYVPPMRNVNPRMTVLTNGDIPNTSDARCLGVPRAYHVDVFDSPITRIQRLCDNGKRVDARHLLTSNEQKVMQNECGVVTDPIDPTDDGAGPNRRHFDQFRIHFGKANGEHEIESTEVDAILVVGMKSKQTAEDLFQQFKVSKNANDRVIVNGDLIVSMDDQLEENVFAIGDMNSEETTNVPHAMFNGKKAAVKVHGSLAKEDMKRDLALDMKRDKLLAKRSGYDIINEMHLERLIMNTIGDEVEQIWENVKARFPPNTLVI